MKTISEQYDEQSQQWTWVVASAQAWFDPSLLDQTCIQKAQENRSRVAGRGNVCVFECAGHRLIHRHYHRGGLPAKWSRDRFVLLNASMTRAHRELHLLQNLAAAGLPAPEPVAARVCKRGATYSADIVTHYIEQSVSLAEYLRHAHMKSGLWKRVGATIRKFHDFGLWHADLNAHNILIDAQGQVYLIDFDRCRSGVRSQTLLQNNLRRLHRSLRKLSSADVKFFFQEEQFYALLQGYRESALK